MKQKIKIVLFLITLAGFPVIANAVYMDSPNTYWARSFDDDWFRDFQQAKDSQGNFEKHEAYFNGHSLDNISWQVLHGGTFDIRHIDLKWLHLDEHWLQILIDRLGWIFDGDTSGPHTRVPEPAALVLLATGILLIAGIRKSR